MYVVNVFQFDDDIIYDITAAGVKPNKSLKKIKSDEAEKTQTFLLHFPSGFDPSLYLYLYLFISLFIYIFLFIYLFMFIIVIYFLWSWKKNDFLQFFFF